MNRAVTRDLMACNLMLAAIAALLMATAGSSIKVIQVLEAATFAGSDTNLRYNRSMGREDESPCILSNTRTYWTS